MKKLLTILILLFASSVSHGQNWNPLNPGATNYFVNNYGYVRAMRIDSLVAYGNQLHYYPYRRCHFNSLGWYSLWGSLDQDTVGSWLGGDVIRKPDGTFLFPNHWNDTIKVKTLAPVGDTWTFYQGMDSVYYIAEVTAIDTMTVLGVIDSVRRITLSAFVNGNMVVSDSFDHTEIILSKGHGFCSVMDLYFFPFHAPGSSQPLDDYYTTNSLRTHAGWLDIVASMPGKYGSIFRIVSYPDPVPSQLSESEVGDVYERSACFPIIFPSAQCGAPFTLKYDSLISKTMYNNGTQYVWKGWTVLPLYDSFSTTILSYSVVPHQDTGFAPNIGSSLAYSVFWERLPEELPALYGDPRWVYYYVPDDTNACFTSPAYYKLRYTIDMASNNEKRLFKLGIGEVGWQSSQYFDGNTMNNSSGLRYIVRNGIACGSYYFPDTSTQVPNAIVNVNTSSSVVIYPNPASGLLNTETTMSNYQLSLINMTGQIVHHRNACNRKQSIDVEGLANGVYNLKLETAEHEVINRKVVVQH